MLKEQFYKQKWLQKYHRLWSTHQRPTAITSNFDLLPVSIFTPALKSEKIFLFKYYVFLKILLMSIQSCTSKQFAMKPIWYHKDLFKFSSEKKVLMLTVNGRHDRCQVITIAHLEHFVIRRTKTEVQHSIYILMSIGKS